MDPGHGWKGKQHWITCDDNLNDMYKAYGSKMEILIWCFLPSKIENGAKKRKSPSDKSDTTEKRTRCVAAIEDKMNEVKDIYAKLHSKHGNKYLVEQYHTWAQLIHIGKQESYDKPPNFPFLWEENRMAIRVVPIFTVQKLLHILPLVPILQVYQSYHQENA